LEPTTAAGENEKEERTGGSIVKVDVAAFAPWDPDRTAIVTAPTADVETVNPTDVAADGTKTLAGGLANLLFELNLTRIPPLGASPSSVTTPVVDFPPRIGPTTEILTNPTGFTTRFAETLFPP